MKKILLLSLVILFACNKTDKENPKPSTHIVDVAPTNYYTTVTINGQAQNSVQGARQYSCKTGDVINIHSGASYNPYVNVSLKSDGVLLWQSQSYSDSFTYTFK